MSKLFDLASFNEYKEDKEYVVESIRGLITQGVYPSKLF